ncbi:MAG: cytochrome c3 family protein [Candidatus Zixiibacteriota bacterium]|nr:MAG: cytochrome c3 family protein [candidate division Zixibacteria bacterium]
MWLNEVKGAFMRSALAVLVLTVPAGTALAQADNCRDCHMAIEDEDGPAHKSVRDIHIQKGLGCVECHGGDVSLEDMDEVRAAAGYRGVPTHRQVPQFCARCHSDAAYMRGHNPALPTDQLDKYRTSVHGIRLFEHRDAKVANCISCHSVHEIGDAKMPHSSTHPANLAQMCGKCHSDADYMAEYGIPTTQVEDYTGSVHGIALLERGDLGAPACNDCHGNHGAAPPGVSSLSAVCGNCHAVESDYFDGSPHKAPFEELGFPMCETCHSNHAIVRPLDEMVGTSEPAVCLQCHTADDGTVAFATADTISRALGQLVAAHGGADSLLSEAIEKGMMTTDEEFRLKEVRQALIQARTLVHSFDADSVLPRVELGLEKADIVKTNAAALIDEYYFRRKGLGFATLFITVLVIALYIKVRRVDRRLRS